MKTSTEIASIAKRVGYENAIEYVAKAGFDAFDLSMFDMALFDWNTQTVFDLDTPFRTKEYLNFVRRLKQIGLENGIICNQSHAPFPCHIPEIRSYLKRAIECTAEVGGEICVIHPINHQTPEENATFYAELLPFAKECGVKIAAENMWEWDNANDCASAAACSSPQNFLKHLELVNDPHLVACLDLGHAEMRGLNTSAEEMILALGDWLKALHIHDNDLKHDSHQIPFSMQIDYLPIIKALKAVNYDGWFTLEADTYLNDFSDCDIQKGIENLAAAALKLEKMFQEE